MRILKAIAVVYLGAVLALTLWPNLAETDVPRWAHLVLDYTDAHGIPLTFNMLEALANVLMFVPFGLLGVWILGDWREITHHEKTGLAIISRRPSLTGVTVQVVLAGVALSTLIETTQLALPGRVSALSDIWHNSLGGLLGALLGAATLAVHLRRKQRLNFRENPAI